MTVLQWLGSWETWGTWEGETKMSGKPSWISLATWHSPTQRASASAPCQGRLRGEASPHQYGSLSSPLWIPPPHPTHFKTAGGTGSNAVSF